MQGQLIESQFPREIPFKLISLRFLIDPKSYWESPVTKVM